MLNNWSDKELMQAADLLRMTFPRLSWSMIVDAINKAGGSVDTTEGVPRLVERAAIFTQLPTP